MRLNRFPFRLKFKYPFKLSSVSRDGTDNLYLRLEFKGAVGWGEAVFPPYLREDLKTAKQDLKKVHFEKHLQEGYFDLIARNHLAVKESPALACAMEVCLLNWIGDLEGKTMHELLNLKVEEKDTSYTIGICSNEEMKQRIEETPQATYFKLKVSEEEVDRILEQYQSVTDKPFVVDANQGFQSREKALACAQKLEALGVKYFEQPFHKDDLESHGWLRSQVSIPIIADESFQRVEDLEEVSNYFDGVNVKIMKSGGVFEARASLYKAKARGMITIVGCMSGSTIAIEAAKSLTSLATYVDLDGVYLLANDPILSGEAESWVKG